MIPKVYTDKRYGLNKEQISNNALSIILKLQNNGYKAFLVGGCIRDSIKGENPKDFDIVTNCEPEEIRGIFRNSRIIGKRFKLVHITFANEIVETTTFRSGTDASSESIEIDEDGKIVRDNQWGTQEEDAFRRDFTINALYYDPYSNEISDYTTGLKDLKEKK
jgi:poly(A) polymerase